MSPESIVHTVALAHHFHSAFSPEQVFVLLREPVSRATFEQRLAGLLDAGVLRYTDGRLFLPGVNGEYRTRQRTSRRIFRRQRPYLQLLVRLPWVRFVGLTGANAFESCPPKDDVDLFIVTARQRLWLCYLGIVLVCRALGKRELLCVNYLVDEDHLTIAHQNYYSAVQLTQMIPLTPNALAGRLLEANPWVYRYLPNAPKRLPERPFYLLKDRRRGTDRGHSSRRNAVLAWLNRWVFRYYSRRLNRKFPQAMGRGIVLGEGVAKLHRNDYQDLYDTLFRQMKKGEWP